MRSAWLWAWFLAVSATAGDSPFLTHTITCFTAENRANKGIAIDLAGKGGACFDTDLVRWAGAWTGGYIELKGLPFKGDHGIPGPDAKGDPLFVTSAVAGWSLAGDAGFKDPRELEPFGPIPGEIAKYRGLYRSGDQVVIQLSVAGGQVRELLTVEAVANGRAVSRTLNIDKLPKSASLLIAEAKGGSGFVGKAGAKSGGAGGDADDGVAVLTGDDGRVLQIGVIDAPKGAKLNVTKTGRVFLTLPALKQATRCKVVVFSAGNEPGDIAPVLDAAKTVANLEALCKGGPSRWPAPSSTRGELGKGDGPYVVDSIPTPSGSQFPTTFGGFDFFKDGKRALLSTWHGDVWLVSGIDGELTQVTWKRYASGIFHGLGLRIVDDVPYVLGRDQITRLHDLDHDGEADFYENFNNDVHVTPNFHEFTFDLQTDAQGNFYFAKGGPVRAGGNGWERICKHHGCLLKVSKDGAKLDIVATGLRAPNGISVGPNGEFTSGDNEGTWTPQCRLNLIKPGGFYGVPPLSQRTPEPKMFDQPLLWMPHDSVDNSSGGQVWVPNDDRWGPFKGRLLHTSYGKCALYHVLIDKANSQGAVVKFPLAFQSGILRPRFNPVDGQLWICGLRGWQTTAGRDGCFQRVRYTGAPVTMPLDFTVKGNALRITFTGELGDEAGDAGSYNMQAWNYRWADAYGSPKLKVSGGGEGKDTWNVTKATLSSDKKTVTLLIDGLKPCWQFELAYKVTDKAGDLVSQQLIGTIHSTGR